MDSKELAHLSLEVEREFRDRAWELGEDIGKRVQEICPPRDCEGDASGSMALFYVLQAVTMHLELAAIFVKMKE